MAPTPPTKGRTARNRLSKTTFRSSSTLKGVEPIADAPAPASQSLFSSTKSDRRRIKHSLLVSRIEKAHSRKPLKRRRPSKKLVTNLESLFDALPEATATSAGGEQEAAAVVDGVMVSRAGLKSRPGATKRKVRLERMERERFERNLAQMASGASKADGGASRAGNESSSQGSAARWAALRSFIQSSMEKDRGNEKA